VCSLPSLRTNPAFSTLEAAAIQGGVAVVLVNKSLWEARNRSICLNRRLARLD
jgi:hypothetical protein